MRELDSIIKKYENLKAQGTNSVLATVVHVEGSAYRRAGARMIVDEFGNITGAISGGCLEGDALRKALLALHQQQNKLITYDTNEDADATIGAQLGCNGVIQVLFEPIYYHDSTNPCELLKVLVLQQVASAIVIGFNFDKAKQQLGTTLVFDEDQKRFGMQPEIEFLEMVSKEANLVLKNQKSSAIQLIIEGETQQIFIQNYQPPIKLIIVGAGNDAQILANLAELLGWEVIVADGRPSHASKQRFVSSCQVIVTKPQQILSSIDVDCRSYFVLMSHNYNYDLEVLSVLIAEDEVQYIGILGPLKKYQRMRSDLKNKGFELTNAINKKIYAPIGLDIGAETPAEIGLSILAEIQKSLTKSSGSSLREKTTPVHKVEDNQLKHVKI
ncbi:xanthine dehydrogenase accessory factor [Pedobacter sp. UYEF25]